MIYGSGGIIGVIGGGGGSPSNALIWRGEWNTSNTPYAANSFVKDGAYAAISLTSTSERVEPTLVGSPEYTLPDDGSGFTVSDSASVIHSGQTYTFTKGGFLKQVRVYVPTLTSDTNYRFILVDETDPASPKVSIIEEPVLQEDNWTTIAANNILVLPEAKLRLIVDALNSGSDTSFNGGWTYLGTNNTGAPTAQGWNRRTQNDVLRFDKTDLDSTDRTSELNGVITGSTIQIIETANASNFFTYTVIGAPIDQGTYVEYPVALEDQGGTGVPVSATSTATFTVPIPQNTDYVQNTGYWATNEPDWATVEGFLEFDGVPQAGNEDNAFGIDIQFQEAVVSDDWDYLPFVGNSSTAGGGGGYRRFLDTWWGLYTREYLC